MPARLVSDVGEPHEIVVDKAPADEREKQCGAECGQRDAVPERAAMSHILWKYQCVIQRRIASHAGRSRCVQLLTGVPKTVIDN
jgi:hypothetical protein